MSMEGVTADHICDEARSPLGHQHQSSSMARLRFRAGKSSVRVPPRWAGRQVVDLPEWFIYPGGISLHRCQ